MKKVLPIVLILLLVSCKNEEAAGKQFEGEFIYVADAAVLKGEDFIYGVKVDEKMQELNDLVSGYKRDHFDMVPVIVEGELSPKRPGAEGWDSILTVKKIVAVLHPEGKPIKIKKTEETARDSIGQNQN